MIYNNEDIRTSLKQKKIRIADIRNFIMFKLSTDTEWIKRAVMKLLSHQTIEEQQNHETMYSNNTGFNSRDGNILSNIAVFLDTKKFLTPAQFAVLKDRLPKYWVQIWNISNQSKMIELIERWKNEQH